MISTPGMNNNSVSHGMELRLDSAIAGCQNAFPPGVTALQVRNTSLSQADLNTKLVALDTPFKTARAAHTTLRQFTSTKSQTLKAAEQFLTDLKAALAGAVGADNQVLAQWGFKVLKPRKPLTSEEKVLRAAKAKLTRQKRGTLGRRQKAAIKTPPVSNVVVSSNGSAEVVSEPNGQTAPLPATPAQVSGPATTPVASTANQTPASSGHTS